MEKIFIDLPETIETERLILQMPKAGFGLKLHEAIIDGYPDYIKWLSWSKTVPTIEMIEEECRRHHADFILREFIRYLIIEKDTQRIVGRCAFPSFQANWSIPQFGISYFITQNCRKNGYASEASQAMVELAFDVLSAKKVEIFCDSENVASTMIPKKLGFALECVTKGGWPRHDRTLANLQCYALFSKNDLIKLL